VVFAHSLRGLDAAALLRLVVVLLVIGFIAIVLLDALAGIVSGVIRIPAVALPLVLVVLLILLVDVIVMVSGTGGGGGGGAAAPAVGRRIGSLLLLLRILLAVIGLQWIG